MKKDIMLRRFVVCAVVLMCVVLLLVGLSTARKDATKRSGMYYAKSAVVSTIDDVRGLVGFTDMRGDEWYWYCDTGTAPWSLDDYVLLVMWDAGTDYAYDDELVSITAEGLLPTIVAK